MNGWFCMVDVGKYTMHGSYGIYIYIDYIFILCMYSKNVHVTFTHVDLVNHGTLGGGISQWCRSRMAWAPRGQKGGNRWLRTSRKGWLCTLPETNSSHLKIGAPWKRRFLLETIIFRGELLVSGRVNWKISFGNLDFCSSKLLKTVFLSTAILAGQSAKNSKSLIFAELRKSHGN